MKLQYGKAEEVGMSSEKLGNAVEKAKSWVEHGIMPTLVLLAARRGIVVIHEAFGILNPEPDSPTVGRDTIFPMGSVSKAVTATLAMILVEDGLLSLNRPVRWYIPEFIGEGKDKVMVHHLLTHTSGLRDDDISEHAKKKSGIVDMPAPEDTQHPAMNKWLFLIYDTPLWKPPGTEMSYCGQCYNFLGEIIRRVSGRALDDFARERLFQPLGMRDTSYVVPDSVRHRIVRGPASAPFRGRDSRESQDIPSGAAGVFSTAMDMAIFCQMFLNQGVYDGVRILSSSAVTAMTRNQIPGISAKSGAEFFPEASWGLGWDIAGNKKWVDGGTLISPDTFSHYGGGGVMIWADPVYEIVGVYLSVSLILNEGPFFRHYKQSDLFVNMVTGAILD